jgi:hypothetical protein
MPDPSLSELVPLLQVSIGPVILISGVGLLLLSLTNRLARIVDRTRALRRAERRGEIDDLEILQRRFGILYRRSRLLRWAILLATVSLLVVAVLIIGLFLSGLFGLQIAWLLVLLFVTSMLALIGALLAFIVDLHLSLVALGLEFDRE